MSTRKSMKIRVNDRNREAVRAALVAEGYETIGKMANIPIYDEAVGYYTYGGNYVLCSTDSASYVDDYFARHSNPEYVLTPEGYLVPAAEYFKQPATSAPVEKTYEPLPLQPFQQWVGDRMKLIVEHISHSMEYSTPVDAALTRELHYLVNCYEEFV